MEQERIERNHSRYRVGAGTLVTITKGQQNENFGLINIGGGGCRISPLNTACNLFKEREGVDLRIIDGDQTIEGLRGEIKYIANGAFGITFHSDSGWVLGRLSSLGLYHENEIPRCGLKKEIEDNKKNLALLDIEALQSSVRDLKGRQFQMLITGLPIVIGLLGTTIGLLIEGVGKGTIEWWLTALPFSSIILAFSFLGIFMQKNASIRRQDAFTLVLQRYLALGKLPPCYRGWQDAYANFNKWVRYGGASFYDIKLNTVSRETFWKLSRADPSNVFRLIFGGIFSLVPIIAISLMMLIAYYAQVDFFLNSILVALAVVILLLGYGLLAYGVHCASGEKGSFSFHVALFDKILHGAPIFSPPKEPLKVC